MDGSDADFAPHMEGRHAHFAPHMEQKPSFKDQIIAKSKGIIYNHQYLRSLNDLCDHFLEQIPLHFLLEQKSWPRRFIWTPIQKEIYTMQVWSKKIHYAFFIFFVLEYIAPAFFVGKTPIRGVVWIS